MPLRQVLRSWLVRQPNRGDWLIIGSAAVTTLTALPLAGLYVVVIAPLLLLPFGLMWILRPILGELGWPATAIAVTAVGVALLGCLAYLNANPEQWISDSNSTDIPGWHHCHRHLFRSNSKSGPLRSAEEVTREDMIWHSTNRCSGHHPFLSSLAREDEWVA